MPTSAEPGPTLLLDTSVAVAYVLRTHPQHDAVSRALGGEVLGLAGHAALETYSVLTRLPAAHRVLGVDAAAVLAGSFPASRQLPETVAAGLVSRLAAAGVDGGSVYDALVAACAVAHDATLVSSDERARSTYARMGARVRFLT